MSGNELSQLNNSADSEDLSFKIDCKTRKSENTLKFEVFDSKKKSQNEFEDEKLEESIENQENFMESCRNSSENRENFTENMQNSKDKLENSSRFRENSSKFHANTSNCEENQESSSKVQNNQEKLSKLHENSSNIRNISMKMQENSPENLEFPGKISETSIAKLEKTFLELSEPMSEDELEETPDIPVEFTANFSTTISQKSSATLLGSSQDPSSSQEILSGDTVKSSLLKSSTESSQECFEVDSYKLNDSFISSKIKITLDSIRQMALLEEKAEETLKSEKKLKKLKLRFKESTIEPSKNKKAEAELEMEFNKEMFSEMEVLGQFNLGFIIAKVNSDLFIVDQHASDEKFNFEDLEKKMKLQTQQLVVPERLELSSIQEITLLENLKIFEMNGFKFLIDEAAEPGRKVKIHSKPFSKNWEFGKEDIEEMIFMLDEAPNVLCRPTRIRTMLASRACRKSVMIGTALTKKQMKTLLEHMGGLDHPWNCPHGRPTLRYLQNLDFIDAN